VYALQMLLVTLFVAAGQRALAARPAPVRQLVLASLVVGFALAHHLTAALLLPALVVLSVLVMRDWAPTARSRLATLVTMTGALLLPLTLYLWLPVRSRAGAAINWSYPETAGRFLVHVTARQYQGRLGSEGLRPEELARFAGEQLTGDATWLLPLLAVVGLVALFRLARGLALVTLVVATGLVLYNMAYPIHDIAVYYGPVLALVAVWAALGAVAVVDLAMRLAGARRAVAGTVAAVVLIGLALVPLAMHWRAMDQRDFVLLRDYIHDTLRLVEPGAVVVTGRWDSFSSPALYYQTVEGLRPDVVVIDLGMLASPVLDRQLARRAPELVEACRDELAAVATIARLAEAGRPYDVAAARETFRRMRRRLLEAAVRRRPTYVTGDLGGQPLLAGYRLVPEGLLFRVAHTDSLRRLPVPDLAGPGGMAGAPRDARETAILTEYRLMLESRARYLEQHGETAAALEYLERAATLGERAAPPGR
jgi:hypothetical protein